MGGRMAAALQGFRLFCAVRSSGLDWEVRVWRDRIASRIVVRHKREPDGCPASAHPAQRQRGAVARTTWLICWMYGTGWRVHPHQGPA